MPKRFNPYAIFGKPKPALRGFYKQRKPKVEFLFYQRARTAKEARQLASNKSPNFTIRRVTRQWKG